MSLRFAASNLWVLLVSVAIGCGSGSTPPASRGTDKPAQAKEDKDAIQGEWIFVASEDKGKSVPAGELARGSITIAGNKVAFWEGGAEPKGAKFTLDREKKPKQIDFKEIGLKEDGDMQLGIYELNGDDLKFCIAGRRKGRPTSFTGGDDYHVMILKREKV